MHTRLHLYTVCLYLLALLFTSSGPIGSSRSPSVLLALLFTAFTCPLSVRPRGRARSARLPARVRACVRVLACARLCVRLLMPGQRWTFLSAVSVWPALLARVCARCARLRACDRARCARLRACDRARCARLLPCLPAPVPACARCSRLYCSFSRRALARCSTLSARRKLFRDRFQAVDIYLAVIVMGGRRDFILPYGLFCGCSDALTIS